MPADTTAPPAATAVLPGGPRERTARPSTPPEVRVDRLSAISTDRFVEPDTTFDWSSLGPGQVLPDELITIADLDVELDGDARARLSREEVASMLAAGIRFEAVLNAVFSTEIADAVVLADPRHVYMLHEIGEETRHQRAFLRLIDELRPQARNPFSRGVPKLLARRVTRLLMRERALFCVLLLAGEEIPDLLQKLASEHPDTDPLIRAVNRYHRQEEARHLSFARVVLPERWARADRLERFRVRHVAPVLVRVLFDAMVHPGVYETVGLPGMETWRAVARTPTRRAVRYHATRPILATLCDTGVFAAGRIPRGWRELCGVDRHGRPRSDDPRLPGDAVGAATPR